jgi:hypothetical protein
MDQKQPTRSSCYRDGLHFGDGVYGPDIPVQNMKSAHQGLLILAITVVALLVAVDRWRLKNKTKQAPAPSSNCLDFSITINKSEVGAITFATIPAIIDKTGLKRTALETDTMIYEGNIDAVMAFEVIAQQRGWSYYQSNKHC